MATYLSSAWIFGVVCVFTLCLDVVIREILLPYVLPELHVGEGFVFGGDSLGFHQNAALLAEQIREHGWSRWQLKPGPAGDSPVGIAAALYAVFGANPLVLLPLNAAVHGLSAVLLVTILCHVSVRRVDAAWGALPFVLFPTAAYWHSQLHRDGIYILGIYAWLAGTLLLFRPEAMTVRRWATTLGLIVLGGALTWLSRPYVMVVIAGLTGGAALLLGGFGVRWMKRRQLRPAHLLARVAFLLVLCVALRAVGGAGRTDIPDYAIDRYTRVPASAPAPPPVQAPAGVAVDSAGATVPAEEQLRLRREQCQQWQDTAYVPRVLEDLALSLVVTREGSYGSSYLGARTTLDWQRCIMSVGDLVAYLPRAVQIGLFAPFPSQWFESSASGGRAARALAGGEMLLAYLAMAAAVLSAWRFRRRPELWVVLFVALAMLVLYAIATPNLGTQHRMRYGFLMLVVGLGVAELSARLRRRAGPEIQ